jgi:hypothetical protein
MRHLLFIILFCIVAANNALGQKKISLKFYGTPIEIPSYSLKVTPLTSLDNEHIAATIASMNGYEVLLNECTKLKTKLELNDWGYLKLVDKVAHACLDNDNEAVLLSFLLMAESGYKVKLAKDATNIVLFFASDYFIYECSYLAVNKSVYFVYPIANYKNKKFEVCDNTLSGNKRISLLIDKLPKFAYSESPKRELKTPHYPEWNFTVSCNENLIDFFNEIPTSYDGVNFMTRWTQLANTPLSENAQRQIYPKMSQLVKGLSQREAVDRILNWIQLAFTYQYDDKVWGRDRAFYPEETLYYPYCDSEDRAALLSRIVTDLLGLKTLFVYFPGHVAVGVAFTDEDVEGEYVTYEGQKYVICDATYFGATAGMVFPQLKGKETKVLPVNAVNNLIAGFPVKLEKSIVKAKPVQKGTAIIEWFDYASTVNKKEYQLKVGIKSNTKVEDVSVIVNGSQSRGINTVKSDGFDLTIDRKIALSEGFNNVVVSVKNGDGITTSEKMITYNAINSDPEPNKKRIALVIGNANYKDVDKRLKNPVNDATDFAAKLESLGFKVIRSIDQTQQNMEKAIYEFGKQAANYDVALFYYAGHGVACNGRNYMIPIDADLPEESAVKYKCTDTNLVFDMMENAHCQMKIMILDACRNNPFARGWHRGVSGSGLSIMDAPRGSFIAFSTSPGDVAQDGTGRNSPYTTALLQALDIPNLSITDFFQEVLDKVATSTDERQTPWTSSSFRGKFIFNHK